MRKNLFVNTLAAVVVALSAASLATAADNWVGAWKLNLAKSKYLPGAAPKSQTLKFEATPAGIKLSSERVTADGTVVKAGYTSKLDGKGVAYTGNPDADTAVVKRIDDNSYENVWTLGGKVTVTSKGSVSADGKTLTITQTGKNAKGDAVNSVGVFEKQ